MVVVLPSRAASASLGCICRSVVISSAFPKGYFTRVPLNYNCFSFRGCTDSGLIPTQVAGKAEVNRSNSSCSFLAASGQQSRNAHKFAAPECPNLLKLREAVERNFQPICFHVKNDYAMGHHVYDQHFYGILCSPLFEGKTYGQINAMVNRVLEPLGLKGRVKLHCEPPSRFEKMRSKLHWRWQLEK